MKTVIIIGGGFAGLNAAKKLANKSGIHIHLFDKKNHHLFQPLLYQVATGGLNPSDIATPIRSEFRKTKNIEIHLAKVDTVNLNFQQIHFGMDKLNYDYLIIATGVEHSYFGKHEWEEFAPGLKTIEQALEIRRRILLAFEKAENELDPQKQKSLMNFVVVGGGPTGVEVAGAIADIARDVLKHDFKKINPINSRIILVEASRKVLGVFPDELSQHALLDLKKLGVEVKLGQAVKLINEKGLQVGEEFIESQTIIWAAGVQASKIEILPTIERDKAGRIKVENNFSISTFPHSFVIGDMSSFQVEDHILPGLAPVAIQSGKYLGKLIINNVKGQDTKPFHYVDKGIMATIGKKKAIAMTQDIKMTGFLAWIAWFFIHVFFLVGIKNKILVIFGWVWSYLFSKRGVRLITERKWQL